MSEQLTAAAIAEDILKNDRPGRAVMFTGKGMTGEKVFDTNEDTRLDADPMTQKFLYPMRSKKREPFNSGGIHNQKLPCLGGCGEDIVQSPGQRVYSHPGKCRKEFKRLRRAGQFEGL